MPFFILNNIDSHQVNGKVFEMAQKCVKDLNSLSHLLNEKIFGKESTTVMEVS